MSAHVAWEISDSTPGTTEPSGLLRVVELDAAADLQLADAAVRGEQQRDGRLARHLRAHLVVAGLDRADPRLVGGRRGERLDALDHVRALQRGADLRARRALVHLDDDVRAAVARVVRWAGELPQ